MTFTKACFTLIFVFLVLVPEPFCCEPLNDSVIFIYKTDGCQVQTPSGSITLQSSDARETTIREVSSRVGRLLREKHPVKLSESADTAEPPELETNYLSAIQFEVTKIPKGVSEEEMLKISEGLPCVEEVARDGVKVADQSFNPEAFLKGALNSASETAGDHPDQNSEAEARKLDVTTSDPYLAKQWALLSESQWGIGAQTAWAESTGHEFVVAVIDSGCDLHHPELQGKLWVNRGELDCYNGIDDDDNGYVDDCYGWDWVDGDNNPSPRSSGHGTGAAGIIASATNNAVGIAGICWFCKIMCLRFISGTEGKISNQVATIDYAVKNGARISNNSYGGYGHSSVEFRAIERAKIYGHLFVSSAGNNNLDTDLEANDHTPSVYNLDNIMAIGASTQHGSKASFSNFGATTVDVFAPGSSIQTVADGGRYAIVSGTSFAAPMATGIAALIWSEFPNLTYAQVKESLVSTCKLSPRLAGKAICAGVLDGPAGMHYAQALLQDGGASEKSDKTEVIPDYNGDYEEEQAASTAGVVHDPYYFGVPTL
eukprot:Selendium_serpulae@DN6221_c0_g3_i1.p1